MNLSQELIEKAAGVLMCEDQVVDISVQGPFEEYKRKATNLLTAIYPDIRKQVLEEAAKVCDIQLDHLRASKSSEETMDDAMYRSGGMSSVGWVASRIRSLMEKEE